MSFLFCTLGFLQTHAAELGMAADSNNSNNIKSHQLKLILSSTSLGKRELLSQSVAPIHTTRTLLHYLHTKLCGTLWIVPSSPNTVIMISVAIGDVQLPAHLFLWTVYLQRNQNAKRLYKIMPRVMDATFGILALCWPPKEACWADEWPPSPADCEQRLRWRHFQQKFQAETGWTLKLQNKIDKTCNSNLTIHSNYTNK